MSDVVVEARELTKKFGDFVAVNRLSLQVSRGEVFGFLGSNGAGKTTAIRMFCGLQRPSSGSAHVLGVDVAEDPEEVKRRIGYMSQRFSLYDDLTVGQNLRFYAGVYGLRRKRQRERIDWAVTMTGLEGKQGLLTGELPGGWKQRLALACAVMHEPRVVFLDEPTGAVDPISRRRFWRLIDDMSEGGTTVFVTTHYLDEAEHCDRLALMHAGRLVALGSVRQLRDVFRGRAVLEIGAPRVLEALDLLSAQDWVLETSVFGNRIHAVVADAAEGRQRVRELLEERGGAPIEVAAVLPSLEDVFIHQIERSEAEARGDAAAGVREGRS